VKPGDVYAFDDHGVERHLTVTEVRSTVVYFTSAGRPFVITAEVCAHYIALGRMARVPLCSDAPNADCEACDVARDACDACDDSLVDLSCASWPDGWGPTLEPVFRAPDPLHPVPT